MEGYTIQPWLVWAVVTVLLMLGAWMRMGAYLACLGTAALLSMLEAKAFGWEVPWQIGSFIAVSIVLFLFYWNISGKKGPESAAAGEGGVPGESARRKE